MKKSKAITLQNLIDLGVIDEILMEFIVHHGTTNFIITHWGESSVADRHASLLEKYFELMPVNRVLKHGMVLYVHSKLCVVSSIRIDGIVSWVLVPLCSDCSHIHDMFRFNPSTTIDDLRLRCDNIQFVANSVEDIIKGSYASSKSVI